MSSNPIHSSTTPSIESDVCRAVVFSIANHFLALPLPAVIKVVSQSAVQGNLTSQQSVVYLENQPLTLLNLYPRLSAIPSHNAISLSAKPGQLLLIAGLQGHPQWAIPVDQPPTLMELSLSTVRSLPLSYRQSIQNLACHVAVLNNSHALVPILLLNLKQAAGIK